MTDRRREFYVNYWSREGKAIPECDPTIAHRKRLLSLALTRFLPPNQRMARMLDAGCGNGEFTGYIKQLGLDVTGIDIAAPAIERARTSFPDIVFHTASLEDQLPFPDMEFDAVWCTEVLEHIFDIHACLSEFNRVLHQGGILIVTTPFHSLVKNLAIALVGFDKHFNPSLSHIRFFTKSSLTESLNLAGFEPLSWRGIGRIWPVYKSFFVLSRKVAVPGAAPHIVG